MVTRSLTWTHTLGHPLKAFQQNGILREGGEGKVERKRVCVREAEKDEHREIERQEDTLTLLLKQEGGCNLSFCKMYSLDVHTNHASPPPT